MNGFFEMPADFRRAAPNSVGREKTTAMFPKLRPEKISIGIREVEPIQSGSGVKCEHTFLVRRRGLFQLSSNFEKKHQPMGRALVGRFGDEAGQTQVALGKGQIHFLAGFAAGAAIGRLAEPGFEFAPRRAPSPPVRLPRAMEQQHFVLGIEAVKQRGDLVGKIHRRQ